MTARKRALISPLGERARAAFEARWTPEVHLTRYLEIIGERQRARRA